MAKYLLILLALIAGCEKPTGTDETQSATAAPAEAPLQIIDIERLQERQGLRYMVNSQTPFTGKAVIGYYKNGQIEEEIVFKDGKPALLAKWHRNGQKMEETSLKDYRQHGKSTEWHENGQVEGEGSYKDDKKDGLWIYWHENGQEAAEVNYEGGEYNGLAVSWYGNGQKASESTWTNGVIESGLYWKPSGEQSQEKIEGGTGTWVRMRENGEKNSETRYINGKQHGLFTYWDDDGSVLIESCYRNDEKVPLSECK